MPKPKAEGKRVAARHNPLHVDILEEGRLSGKLDASLERGKEKSRKGDNGDAADFLKEDGLVPQRLSKRILRLVEEQDADDRAAREDSSAGNSSADEDDASRADSEDIEDIDAHGFVVIRDEEEEDGVYAHRVQQQQAAAAGSTLADFIIAKLRKSDQAAAGTGEPRAEEEKSLPPKVVEVYTSMALFLQRYRSGRLPKAFKVLPRLQRWEEVLLLCEPQNWSKQAMYEATKIFVSNLSSAGAQRFLCLVLLPAVREDIAANKKLNYHLYRALKKAVFKPAAFFKGIFLPLALEGCSGREAVIVGSVVAKVSLPPLHAAAALLRLALVSPDQWVPAVSHLMGVLINKKYSLPAKALQACVAHFHNFAGNTTVSLPVSWHKALLVFVQRYKFSFSSSERKLLRRVLKAQYHAKIGPEIRRELLAKNPVAELRRQQEVLGEHAVPAAREIEVEMDG